MSFLVSVIIPVYNAGENLRESIQSALDQDYSPIEIIVVDDGSSDNSLTIAESYENKIKLIKQKNAGASVARNTGLAEAKGKYIQFLDADDFLSKNKIRLQVEVLEKNENYIGLCPTVHFYHGENPFKLTVKHEWFKEGTDDPVDFLIKLYGGYPGYGGMVQPNAWLTPRSVIEKSGNWNPMRNPDDDGEFFCRVLLASKGVRYVPDVVNYYRKYRESGSLSSHRSYDACKNILKSIRLKSSNLLTRTNKIEARFALARIFYENALTFYPRYKDLANMAIAEANKILPEYKLNPYSSGIDFKLSKVIGWRNVKMLRHYFQPVINTIKGNH